MSERTFDVFLSHRMADRTLATEVSRQLEQAELKVFRQVTTTVAAQFVDEIREALAESRALVVVMSPAAATSTTIAMEVGAAQAWQKAVFVVLAGLTKDRLPTYLKSIETYSRSDLKKLVSRVLKSSRGLTDSQQEQLNQIYATVGIPTDQLSRRPIRLERLARAFNRRAGVSYAPEQLLQELIRMRKAGRLKPLKRRSKE